MTGHPALLSALPLSFHGTTHALVGKADEAVVMAPIVALRDRFLMIGGGALNTAMRRLADGESALHTDGAARRDEIGDMSRAVKVFRDSAFARIALEAEQKRETEARLARETTLRDMIAGFRAGIGDVVSGIRPADRRHPELDRRHGRGDHRNQPLHERGEPDRRRGRAAVLFDAGNQPQRARCRDRRLDVARSVEGIASSVDETARSAGNVENALRQLNARAAVLNRQVSDFLGAVQAA